MADGAPITLEAVAKPGFVFDYWTYSNGNDTLCGSPVSNNFAEGTTITAHFKTGGDTVITQIAYTLLPNPAQDWLHVEFLVPEDESCLQHGRTDVALFEILDMKGRLVSTSEKRLVQNGINNLSFSIAHLPEGVYLVRFKTSFFEEMQKVVVGG